MQVGLNFLSKTKMGAMKDIMSPKFAQPLKQQENVQNNDNKQRGKTDLASMSSGDLMKYVYNNTGKQDNNDIKLPAHLKYGNEDFAVNGKSFDDTVKMITQKTGDSKSKIEQTLKKEYGNPLAGGTLNFQA